MPLKCNGSEAEGRMTDGPAAMIKALIAAFLLAWTPVVAPAQSSGEIDAYQRAVTAMRDGDWNAALRKSGARGSV